TNTTNAIRMHRPAAPPSVHAEKAWSVERSESQKTCRSSLIECPLLPRRSAGSRDFARVGTISVSGADSATERISGYVLPSKGGAATPPARRRSRDRRDYVLRLGVRGHVLQLHSQHLVLAPQRELRLRRATGRACRRPFRCAGVRRNQRGLALVRGAGNP